jgi:N-acyl-D-amino-acid deacylase
MYDLLIKNGKILDGTGGPWFIADLAVIGKSIAKIGKIPRSEARAVVELEGKVLCPGFIDPHSHADIIATAVNPENQIFQGVTTQVTGNCGKSNAPVNPKTLGLLKKYLGAYTPKGVELDWEWASLGDWLDIVDRQGYLTDLGVLVGQGTIRMAVMGMDDGEASSSQIEEMKALVAQSMEHGALGLSTGLIYPPGSFTNTGELIELCKVVASYGGIYASHIRSEGAEELEAVEEAIEIGRKSGCRVQISHHQVSHPYDGLAEQTLSAIEMARVAGIDVAFDVYPYLAGYTQISTLMPKWVTIGGVDEMLARIRDPLQRERIAEELTREMPGWDNLVLSAGWNGLFISSTKTDRSLEGKSIEQIAVERGENCSDTLFDIIIAERAEASVVIWTQSEKDHERIITHPLSIISSDGFPCNYSEPRLQGKPHPRCFGTFPRVLGRYVREKHLLNLETAIWKMTGFTAQRYGLHDRGVIKERLLADLVVFDPDTIMDRGTFEDPFQKPEGIELVIKNGQVVVEGNRFSGKILGKSTRLT